MGYIQSGRDPGAKVEVGGERQSTEGYFIRPTIFTRWRRLKAGMAWVNRANQLNSSMPFGGFKQSGIGRELGEYALHNYTAVKAAHISLDIKL